MDVIGTDDAGDGTKVLATSVKDSEIDIDTYDNTGQNIAVIANVSVPGVAIAAGVKKVLVSWTAAAARELCYLRFGGAATPINIQLIDQSSLILRVPDTGNRILYVYSPTGTTAGSAVNVQPIP